MGCSASSYQDAAEQEFFKEQQNAKARVGHIPSVVTQHRPPDVRAEKSVVVTAASAVGTSLCEGPNPTYGKAPRLAPLRHLSPAHADAITRASDWETPTLPGDSSFTPRARSSASGLGGAGGLNVGAVFRAALEDQCSVILTAETLPHIVQLVLKALDKDANGTIELSDLKKFMRTVCAAANMEVPPDEQISEVFQQLDIDGSGSISRAELAAAMFRWFIVGVC